MINWNATFRPVRYKFSNHDKNKKIHCTTTGHVEVILNADTNAMGDITS